MDCSKKILMIERDALRGVVAVTIIEQIEKVTGKKMHEISRCFYGTSTGVFLTTFPRRKQNARRKTYLSGRLFAPARRRQPFSSPS